MQVKTRKGKRIKVIIDGEDKGLTPGEMEMDIRAREAVRAAIRKAKICKKPIARYDSVSKKAYLEYPDGVKK